MFDKYFYLTEDNMQELFNLCSDNDDNISRALALAKLLQAASKDLESLDETDLAYVADMMIGFLEDAVSINDKVMHGVANIQEGKTA